MLGYVPNGSFVWDAAFYVFFLSLLEQISAAKTTYLGEMNHNRKQGFTLDLLLDCTVCEAIDGGFEQS